MILSSHSGLLSEFQVCLTINVLFVLQSYFEVNGAYSFHKPPRLNANANFEDQEILVYAITICAFALLEQ